MAIEGKTLRFCYDRLVSLMKTLEITASDDFHGVHMVRGRGGGGEGSGERSRSEVAWTACRWLPARTQLHVACRVVHLHDHLGRCTRCAPCCAPSMLLLMPCHPPHAPHLNQVADFATLVGTYSRGFAIIIEPFDDRLPSVSLLCAA